MKKWNAIIMKWWMKIIINENMKDKHGIEIKWKWWK